MGTVLTSLLMMLKSAKIPASCRANSSSLPRIFWVSMDQACAVQRQSEESKIKTVSNKIKFQKWEKEASFDIKKRKSYKISKIEPAAKIHRIAKYQSKTSPQNSLFKSVILRWGRQQHLAAFPLGSVCGMETHLSISGLGQTEATFSEDILAAADRLTEHEKDFVVLMWNMSVAWGFPELPKRCTHSHVVLGCPPSECFSLLFLYLVPSEVSAL